MECSPHPGWGSEHPLRPPYPDMRHRCAATTPMDGHSLGYAATHSDVWPLTPMCGHSLSATHSDVWPLTRAGCARSLRGRRCRSCAASQPRPVRVRGRVALHHSGLFRHARHRTGCPSRCAPTAPTNPPAQPSTPPTQPTPSTAATRRPSAAGRVPPPCCCSSAQRSSCTRGSPAVGRRRVLRLGRAELTPDPEWQGRRRGSRVLPRCAPGGPCGRLRQPGADNEGYYQGRPNRRRNAARHRLRRGQLHASPTPRGPSIRCPTLYVIEPAESGGPLSFACYPTEGAQPA